MTLAAWAGSRPLIVRGKYLVAAGTDTPFSVVADGAALVDGDTITAIGRFEDLHAAAPLADIVGEPTDIVIPGFVNSHHHGWGLSPFQLGVLDDRLEPWLIDLISMPVVDPYLDTLYSAMKLVRSGVTTVQHAGFTRDPQAFASESREALRAYRDIGLRVSYAVQVRDQNSYAYEDDAAFLNSVPAQLRATVRAAEEGWGIVDPAQALDLVATLDAENARTDLISLAICAEGPEWCSPSLLRKTRRLADELGLRLHLHCLESPLQRAYLEALHQGPVLDYLDSLGVLGADVSIAHAVWLSDRDIELCAARGVVVCHCPSSNLRLRNGILPLQALRDGGVTVSLGLDSSTINDDDDFLQEIRLAARLHRLPSGLQIQRAPSAPDILAMATTNGAVAMGVADVTGSLAPGLRADIVTIDLATACFPFTFDGLSPLDAVVYRAKREHVRDVVVNGTPILRDGRFTQIDEPGVEARLRESALAPQSERFRVWQNAMSDLRPSVAAFFDAQEWPPLVGSSTYWPNAPLADEL